MEAYGSKCVCCGEDNPNFIVLAHSYGGGNKHRKGRPFVHYEDAVRRKFPPDYRLLCYNCNGSIVHRGYCPHQLESQEVTAA